VSAERLLTLLRGAESLLDCFGLGEGVGVVALVGAGGKTSLLYALAREVVRRGKTVATTTTTKIFPPAPDQSPRLLLAQDDPELRTLPRCLQEHRHVTVATSVIAETGKLQGVDERLVAQLSHLADCVLVEADGAAGRPIKAPARWEPVIPPSSSLVIPVVGLDSVGKPATEAWAFRLKELCAVTGLSPGAAITPQAIARLLCHPRGGLKNVPAKIPVIPLLNKEDLLLDHGAVEAIAGMVTVLARERIRLLVVGSVGKIVRELDA
jgi:probable selenium-dependent hydroxylase accessory protein YqeC